MCLSGSASIDTWITQRVETTGFELVDRLEPALLPEHRKAIPDIKRDCHRRGQLRDGLSTIIYEAVIEKGIRTMEEFRQFPLRELESGFS